jgi:hypothetical protein
MAVEAAEPLYRVHTVYIGWSDSAFIISPEPFAGSYVVQTSLTMVDLQEYKLFKSPTDVWRFARTVGRPWKG